MATLMTFKSANGSAERCDARCYDAKGSDCVCCCGGLNHGVGFVRAFGHTVEGFDEIVKKAEKISKPQLKVSNIKQNKKFLRYFEEAKKQLVLFGEESESHLLERMKGVRL